MCVVRVGMLASVSVGASVRVQGVENGGSGKRQTGVKRQSGGGKTGQGGSAASRLWFGTLFTRRLCHQQKRTRVPLKQTAQEPRAGACAGRAGSGGGDRVATCCRRHGGVGSPLLKLVWGLGLPPPPLPT